MMFIYRATKHDKSKDKTLSHLTRSYYIECSTTSGGKK